MATRRRQSLVLFWTLATVATASTCPWTMWPPRSESARAACSRMTLAPGASEASVERSSVSWMASKRTPFFQWGSGWFSGGVAVRHTPLTAMESPVATGAFQSGATSVMARPAGVSEVAWTVPSAWTRPVNTE